MPKLARHKRTARDNGKCAAPIHMVTEEDRHTFSEAEPLTLKAPARFTVDRGKHAAEMKQVARRSWRYFVDNYSEVRLDARHGDYNDPDNDYGAIRARMDMVEAGPEFKGKVGLRFMGTSSYDKKGKSRQHEAASHAEHRTLIAMAFASLASSPTMVLIHPRLGIMRGGTAKWHTDPNPRGAHPNAVRPVGTGFGILIYRAVDFRCSFVWFHNNWVIPLDLSPFYFRYVWLDPESQKEGSAMIVQVDASRFWEEVVHSPDGPIVLGSMGCSIVSLDKGFLLTCPLDYTDIRERKQDLDVTSIEAALATAGHNPITPPSATWEVVGNNPDRWDVFYGWRNPHCSFGDPMVARAHVTNCPYRQNGTGQNRKVSGTVAHALKPINPVRASILRLKPGMVILVEGVEAEVVEVLDALDLYDMHVSVRYEGQEGHSYVAHERLACKEWEHRVEDLEWKSW